MFETWQRNISDNLSFVEEDKGPELVAVVSGSKSDQRYWRQHFAETARDVFRSSGGTSVTSVFEESPKGNFLGTFRAWDQTKLAVAQEGKRIPEISLMCMVFGKGKRLSPFTQALGNRKPAFLTPMMAPKAQVQMRTADISNLYSNTWTSYLRAHGFRGLVVKWGDEAIIPGLRWKPEEHDFHDVDAVRFLWQVKVTEGMAREKEWLIVNERTKLIEFEYARQEMSSLLGRVSEFGGDQYKVAVNLGSLAISHDFLDAAIEVLGDDIRSREKAVDWDPYGWMALFCKDASHWQFEAEYEQRISKKGIRNLEAIYPDFYPKIARLRATLEQKKGRPLKVGMLDFGNAFWMDIGLHVTLRQSLESLTTDSERGMAARELFGLPHERDKNGNIIVRSIVPDSADIRDSVIVDSVILDKASVIHQGVVISGRHRLLHLPFGGCALFSAADSLSFTGPHGVTFLSVSPSIIVPEGGRHTTLFIPQGPQNMISNEAIWDYSADNYEQPILGNPISFEQAGDIMSAIDGQELEARWQNAWRNWLE